MVWPRKTTKNTVHALCNEIQQDLSQMSSTNHNSVLMNDGESIQTFSWNTANLELKQQMPTFSSLLNGVGAKENKILHCGIICMILMSNQKMSTAE